MILSDFEGQWRLDRQIEHDDGTIARFSGTAQLTPDPDGLVYDETGTLEIPGQATMQATRRYFWKEGLTMWFEDGRFFHTIPLDGAEAHHNCPPDDYRVRYDFSEWPTWKTFWQVSGPRKSYRMASIYVR